MGLIELPLYMPKQAEQFSNNQRLRPDIQAKARRGEAAYGLLDTAAGGALNLLSQFKKAKEQRQEDEISRRNLTFDSKVHDLALRLSERPLSASSEEVALYGEDQRAMPNYSYTQEQLEYFSADALDGVSDRKVRDAVALHIQGKRATASDTVFKWDSGQAKITALSNLANTVQTYENQRDLAGAVGAIDSARASGWIDNEGAIKYKNNVRLNISVGGLGLQARSMSAQEGLALLENPENMKWQMEGGALSEIPAETQKSLITEYKQEKTLQDDQHKTGFVDLFIKTNTLAQCDAALSQVGSTDFLDPGKKKEIVDWFLRRRDSLENDQIDPNSKAYQDGWYDHNEDRLAEQVATYIGKGNYIGAKRLIEAATGQVRGKFSAQMLNQVQAQDDQKFQDIRTLAKAEIDKLPEPEQGKALAQVFNWYQRLVESPNPEQIQKVLYDIKTESFKRSANNFYDFRKQTLEIEKGAAEMSAIDQSEILYGTAAWGLRAANSKYPKGVWGIDFANSARAYPDQDDVFGLGSGHPIMRTYYYDEVEDRQKEGYFAMVGDEKGKDIVLKRFVEPPAGGGYWVDVQPLTKKTTEPKPAPKPSGTPIPKPGPVPIIAEPTEPEPAEAIYGGNSK